jgi:hypothetical protein
LDFFVCPKIKKILASMRQGSSQSREPSDAGENEVTNQKTSQATPSPNDVTEENEPSPENNP